MSDHLPECECYGRNHGGCALCICDRLRACEERVSRQHRHVCPDNNCCMGDPHD